MRIGIEFTSALRQGAGIGRFTRELVRALLTADPTGDYLLVHARTDKLIAPDLPRPVPLHALPFGPRFQAILWQRLRLPVPVETFTGPLDIFHAPDYVLPPLRHAEGLVTVHDLSFVKRPECAAPSLRRYLEHAVPDAVRRASAVLTDSVSSRTDLIEWLGVPPERVHVVYGGVAPRFRPVDDTEERRRVAAKYGATRPFVLSVSTLEPRKNLITLIEAFALWRSRTEAPHQLIIGGGPGWQYEGIYRRAEELRLGDAVVFPGFVDDADLPALLSQARVFAYPSLYEGFGLPPLEAMACGTPVIASTAPCLPEILGNAAILVDPMDVDALADALNRVASDNALRDDLSRRGRARAATFTWAGAAKQLMGVYAQLGRSRDAAHGPGRP
ncbi:MAG: glycosyltransferase family 1 protein [Chloroflexi bacterium]|nr:glycosyltransferase family 1 protein [Chloroflexota bacterium]